MAVNPIYSPTQIADLAATFRCCAATKAFEVIDKIQHGADTCECDAKEVQYVAFASQVLESYIPPYDSAGARSTFTFELEADTEINDLVITVDGDIVWSPVHFFLTLADLAFYIAQFIDHATIELLAIRPDTYVLTIYAPDYTFNNVSISVAYEGKDSPHEITGIFTNGVEPSSRTAAENCLSTLQVQNIIENCNKICGCGC